MSARPACGLFLCGVYSETKPHPALAPLITLGMSWDTHSAEAGGSVRAWGAGGAGVSRGTGFTVSSAGAEGSLRRKHNEEGAGGGSDACDSLEFSCQS